MAKTFSVNSANDLYIGSNGNLSISSGLEAVLQICAQAAKTLLGEMVLAIDQGISYFENVWTGVPNVQQFQAELRQAFLNVEGVLEVVSLLVSQSANTLSYTAVIRTSFGSGAISG